MAKKTYVKREEDALNPTTSDNEELNSLIDKISSNPDILSIIKKIVELSEQKAKPEELSIPDCVFNKKLTLFESSVKYLKENLGLNFKQISEIMHRDQRNIWQVYNSSTKKHKAKFSMQAEKPTKVSIPKKVSIPVSIFSTKEFSVLECFVVYLKDGLGLTYSAIGKLLRRDDRTIWTVYSRAKKKLKKNVK